MATARSATAPEFIPGTFETATPLARHSPRSILLKPSNTDATILRFGTRASFALSRFSILADSRTSTSAPRALIVCSTSQSVSSQFHLLRPFGKNVCISGCIASMFACVGHQRAHRKYSGENARAALPTDPAKCSDPEHCNRGVRPSHCHSIHMRALVRQRVGTDTAPRSGNAVAGHRCQSR